MKRIRFSKRKMIIVFLTMVFLIFGLGYLYLNDYYRADEDCVDIRDINSNKDGVEVLVDDEYIYFVPDNNNKEVGIIFYPGGKVEAKAYSNLMLSIAKLGYTTVLVNMPYNLAILGINDALEPMNEFKIDNWYLAGHSLGGVAATEFVKNSDDVKGLILLASYPSSDLSNSDLRVLSMYGSEDKVLNLQSYEKSKDMLPKDTKYVTIDGGNHGGFGNYGVQNGDGKAMISSRDQQEITALEIKEFIEDDI